jgi:hypothetical protein
MLSIPAFGDGTRGVVVVVVVVRLSLVLVLRLLDPILRVAFYV